MAIFWTTPDRVISLQSRAVALAVILPELFAKTDALIDDAGQRKLLTEIELPLAGVLARMECAGFDVDKAGIEAFSKKPAFPP